MSDNRTAALQAAMALHTSHLFGSAEDVVRDTETILAVLEGDK
jgi:hypothetical protein